MSKDLIDKLCRTLRRGDRTVLATIVSHHGSTPRTAGTKMLIFDDRDIYGTIGGGLAEAKVVARASEIMDDLTPVFMSLDLTNEDAAASDMICGGRLEVLLSPLKPESGTIDIYEQYLESLVKNRPSCFITGVTGDNGGYGPPRHGLLSPTGDLTGDLPLPPATVEEILEQDFQAFGALVKNSGRSILVLEPNRKAKTAYFIGAGHVAGHAAKLAGLVGFRVAVADDRADFANRKRFPTADQVLVLDDFGRSMENLDVDEDSFFVIVTRGHIHDREALARALKTNAGYIGMIGSRKKRMTIYKSLLADGFTEKDLERVHSPIGLTIGAETPEEIAVSIIAEMIQVRAGL